MEPTDPRPPSGKSEPTSLWLETTLRAQRAMCVWGQWWKTTKSCILVVFSRKSQGMGASGLPWTSTWLGKESRSWNAVFAKSATKKRPSKSVRFAFDTSVMIVPPTAADDCSVPNSVRISFSSVTKNSYGPIRHRLALIARRNLLVGYFFREGSDVASETLAGRTLTLTTLRWATFSIDKIIFPVAISSPSVGILPRRVKMKPARVL